jgi:hypothetical protein
VLIVVLEFPLAQELTMLLASSLPRAASFFWRAASFFQKLSLWLSSRARRCTDKIATSTVRTSTRDVASHSKHTTLQDASSLHQTSKERTLSKNILLADNALTRE